MKTAEVHKSSSAKNLIQAKRQPFFKKEGGSGFFSKNSEVTEPFFNQVTTIQPKLTVGDPNDKYEVEADSIADQVVQKLREPSNDTPSESAQENVVQPKPLSVPVIQEKCSACEEEEQVQRKEDEDLSETDVEVQEKPIFEDNVEHPEEEVQTKLLNSPIEGGLGGVVQTKCDECEQEEQVQKKEEEEVSETDVEVQKKPIFESATEQPETEVQAKPLQLSADASFDEGKVTTENSTKVPEVVQTKSLVSSELSISATKTIGPEEKLQEKEEEISDAKEEIHTKLSDTENPEPPDDGENIQTKSDASQGGTTSDLQSRLNASKGGGSSLSSDVQSSMGDAMGADFSNVRVHTDSRAMQMNKDLGAQAFAHGSDIYFNEGKYDTNSTGGKHLLAHELTHTIQQNSVLKKKVQRRIIGENVQMNILLGHPPKVELYGPYSDSAIAEELYGDSTISIRHDPNNYFVIFVDYSLLLNRWKSSFSGIGNFEAGIEPSGEIMDETQEVEIPNVDVEDLISNENIIPPPEVESFIFREIQLTANSNRCKSQLLYLYHNRGESYTTTFIESFNRILSSGFNDFPRRRLTEEEIALGNQILPVLRSEFNSLIVLRDRFAEVVKNAAVVQLQRNLDALAAWRTYVLDLLPNQVYAQAYAITTRDLYSRVEQNEINPTAPFSNRELFEIWTRTGSPYKREVNERVIREEIGGGCQFCHETNQALQRTYRDQSQHRDRGVNWQAPQEIVPDLARYSQQNPSAAPNIHNQSNRNVSSQGTNNTVNTNRIDQNQYPGTHSVLQSLNQIRTYIDPLGPDGYNIISSNLIYDAQTPQDLVNNVIEKLDERRDQYLLLKEKIENGEVEYTKLGAILNSLFPLAIPEVKLMINADLANQSDWDLFMLIGGIAALLLTLFPPTFGLGVAMGMGFAAYGVYDGLNSIEEGGNYDDGRYSGVFTREQEEAAGRLMVMGYVSVVMSAFDLGSSAFSIGRIGLATISRAGRELTMVNRVVGSSDNIAFELSDLTSQQARVRVRDLAGNLIVDTSLDYVINGMVTSLTSESEIDPIFTEEHPDVMYISGRADINMSDMSEFTWGEDAFIQRQTDWQAYEEAVRQSMRRGGFQQRFGWPPGMSVVQGTINRSGHGIDAIGVHRQGGMVSIFIVEIKSSLNPSLGQTNSGTQMGRGWIMAKLDGILAGNNPRARRTYRELVRAMGLENRPDVEARAFIRRKFREIPSSHLGIVVRQHADLGPRRTMSDGSVRGRGMGRQVGGLSSSGSRVRVGRR